jgi:hypothetical protein
MPDHIVTAEEVAEATGQSLESVARSWHEIGKDQPLPESEDISADDELHTSSDD